MHAARRPRDGRPLLSILLVTLILAGCYGAPGAEPVSVEPAPVASSPPVEEQPAGETAGPITYDPGSMWSFLASMGEGMRRAETLAGAVDFAELIVVGRYVGVARGGTYGSDATAVALIDVDSVIKGTPNLGPDGLLRVEFVLAVGPSYPEKLFADLQRSIPKDPALLYLFSWASFFDLTGEVVPDWRAGIDRTDRYKTIGNDGAMRVWLRPPSLRAGDDQ